MEALRVLRNTDRARVKKKRGNQIETLQQQTGCGGSRKEGLEYTGTKTAHRKRVR